MPDAYAQMAKAQTMKRIIVSLALIGLLAVLWGCDGYIRASGYVYSGRGEPLDGATLSIQMKLGVFSKEQPQGTTRTDATGFYRLATVVPPGFHREPLQVTKEGYKPCRVNIWTLRSNEVDFMLATDESVLWSSCRKR